MHHLTKKIAVTAGALTLAATGIAAAAGSPPEEADAGLTTAEEQVGVELPATKDAHPGAPEEEDGTDDAVDVADESDAAAAADDADAEGEGQGPVDNHGAEVSAVAQSDETTGREHGEAVSEVARQGHGPDAESEEDAADDAAPQADLGADDAGEHGRQ